MNATSALKAGVQNIFKSFAASGVIPEIPEYGTESNIIIISAPVVIDDDVIYDSGYCS